MRVYKRIYFTLLELCIVLSLVLVIGGLGAVKWISLVKEQEFLCNVKRVQGFLTRAQEIVLLEKGDATVLFEKKGNVITARLFLENKFFKKAFQKSYPLKGVQEILIKEKSLGENEPLKVCFFSFGHEETEIILKSSFGTRYLHIYPYPSHIVVETKPVPSSLGASGALYPHDPFGEET